MVRRYIGISILKYHIRTGAMRNLLKISDAAVLGIHALGTLTGAEEPVSASRMAAALGVSEAHLSKVLQRLVRAGLVSSSRGPREASCSRRTRGA